MARWHGRIPRCLARPRPFPWLRRISGFVYAIRNIVAEARKVEAAGRKVRYLNIGDPITFGFKTPPHMIEAVERAMRDGHNGYAPSVGILAAREAVSAECVDRGMPMTADRVVITSGTSEGIELALTALAEPWRRGADPGTRRTLFIRQSWPRLAPGRSSIAPIRRAAGSRTSIMCGAQSPARRVRWSSSIPTTRPARRTPIEARRALVELAEEHNFPLLADEVYADLAFDGPVPALAALNPDAPVITFSSLSKAYLAPGWRMGWLAAAKTARLDDVLAGIKKLADGRLCSTGPMEHALVAALTGDRSHQQAFRDALRERAAITHARFNAIDGITCVAPTAAFYAMPKVSIAAWYDR